MSFLLNILLFPVSVLYKIFSLIDRQLKKMRRTDHPNLFIISVDNLTFGGSGKTSMVRHLAEAFTRRRIPFSVVSRGYKSSVRSGCREVSVDDTAGAAGDEALMIKHLFPESTVMIGPDRLTALKRLQSTQIRIVILDDGFQSAHIRKDFSILLDTPGKPFHYYRCFRFLARSTDLHLLYQPDESPCPVLQSPCERYWFRHLGLRNAQGDPIDPGETPMTAFSALGDNERFFRDLKQYNIRAFHPFPDHHFFTQSDIDTLKKSIENNQAKYCVCTLKDFVKLPASIRQEGTFIYAENGIQLQQDIFPRLWAIEKFRDYAAPSN